MSGYAKILIAILLLFISSGFARGKEKYSAIDTSKSNSSVIGKNIPKEPGSGGLDLSKHKLSLEEMYKLYLLYNSGYNNMPYNKLDFSDLSAFNYNENKSGYADSLSYFNENLSKMLSLNYKELNKYDLGAFGQYLGISKGLFSIILAILSVK